MSLLDFLAQPSTSDIRGALRNIPVRKGGILPLTEYGDGSARLDWTAGVPGSIMEAFTAPARAYRGEIPEDQMIPEGLNFAGSVTLGSAAVPRGRAAPHHSPAPHVAMPALPPENPVMRYLSPRHAEIGMDSYNALALEAPAIRDFNPHDAGIIGLPGMRSASQPTTPLTSDFMGHQRFAGRRELDFVPDTESMIPNIGELANEGAGKLSSYDRTALNQAWRRKVARTGELFSNPETSAAPGLGLMAAAKQEPKGFIAYHGSPHDFDKFDMGKIGTGEGAQAYGHGLYFADSQNVAETYKGAGVRQSWSQLDPPDNPGKMYQVRINADPDHFLDWDKPLSQQSEAVRSAMQPLVTAREAELMAERQAAIAASEQGGSYASKLRALELRRAPPATIDNVPDILGRIATDYKVKASAASQSLREAGIPGIKYLDQGSRAAGDGSRNYVVFDDKLIDILRKYGLLGMMGGGAALASGSGDANARGLLP